MKFQDFLLTEAPLPDDWDKSKFKKGATFKETVSYAQERASKLGTGSSRVVFNIEYKGRETALKIAKNSKGIAQNIEEVNYLEDGYIHGLKILCPMIDYDEENGDDGIKWIHVEKGDKIKDSDFKKYTGGLTAHELVAASFNETVHNRKSMHGSPSQAILEKSLEYMEENDITIYHDLVDLFSNFDDIKVGDLTRVANWVWYDFGNNDRRPVICDLGFNDVTAKLYGQ